MLEKTKQMVAGKIKQLTDDLVIELSYDDTIEIRATDILSDILTFTMELALIYKLENLYGKVK